MGCSQIGAQSEALRAKQGDCGVSSLELFCRLGRKIWARSSLSPPGHPSFLLCS